MHQKEVPKSSGFKPVKNKPGLAILCCESLPLAGSYSRELKGVREQQERTAAHGKEIWELVVTTRQAGRCVTDQGAVLQHLNAKGHRA